MNIGSWNGIIFLSNTKEGGIFNMAKKEKCFVMMPFTTPEKYKDTDHFDKVYEQIFVPAIEKAGYEPYRVDEN